MKAQETLTPARSKPVVLGTGLVALDVILPARDAQPMFAAGGTCANVLAALSYLDWQAFPVARLGPDPASEIIRRDLEGCEVQLNFTASDPTARTPIIVQHIVRKEDAAEPRHRFSWHCPQCGSWFPSFRPVLASVAEEVASTFAAAAVFFFDRVSRAAIVLAVAASRKGALVVFEPSGKGDPDLFSEALKVAHVLKYSRERFPSLSRRQREPGILLEIETLGKRGLRYRGSLLRAAARWRESTSIPVATTVDAAGAGDWCTAAFISRIGRRGLAGVEQATAAEIEDALRFGQATAAWACQYEGARGGMYETSRADFRSAVAAILAGVATDKKAVGYRSTKARSMAEVCSGCAEVPTPKRSS